MVAINKLPRKFSVKGCQCPSAPLIALHHTGQPVWTPRDYAGFAREGYARNPVVYRAIRLIAESAASVPIRLFNGAAEIAEHPLLDLIAAPNAGCCGTDLLEDWYGYLLIAGNAYIEAVSVGGSLRELHVLRPDRMKIVAGGDGWPEAYDYSANGVSVRFRQSPERGLRPILHMALFNPSNDYYGMSPVEAASAAVDLHNAASAWNKALLDNAARPSGALVYTGADGHLSEEQFARLKAELAENYQGAMNAGRPLLLEGGLDWKTMSLSPKDMDFIEAKHVAAREIALALGVPPMLLGIPGDNTYSNYQEANRVFWRQTVLGLVGRTLKALSVWLGPAYGEWLQLRPALDAVDALSADRASLWDRVQRADFLTVDEKRAAVGLGPLGVGDASVGAG
ncbi:phage portal protein [Rhodomicrobium vannielii]|uniref:phage portal protein n=1 Tax=Rhodomicrobium vannielii TaxID=1069 RepID=UPI0032AED5AA